MAAPGSAATLRIAADVGGTFTDVAIFDEQTRRIRLGKTLSTPARLIDGMAHGVYQAGGTTGLFGVIDRGSQRQVNSNGAIHQRLLKATEFECQFNLSVTTVHNYRQWEG